MTAYAAHDLPGHAADDGMIATLGLLPGTWIGEVEKATLNPRCDATWDELQQASGPSRPQPRKPAFRGCWRPMLRKLGQPNGSKRVDARPRGPALSQQRLERHETKMEHKFVKEVTDLFQDVFPEDPLPKAVLQRISRQKPPAADASSVNSGAPKAAAAGPKAPVRAATAPISQAAREPPGFCDAVSATLRRPGRTARAATPVFDSVLVSRPSSRASVGSHDARAALTTPKGRAEVSAASASARAYDKLRRVPPRCGAWDPSSERWDKRRPEVAAKKQTSRFDKDMRQAGQEEDEDDVWRIQFPMGHEWAKSRRLPKWDFCRVTGPWSNRMRSGSVMNYKQWGPDGPLWVLEDGK